VLEHRPEEPVACAKAFLHAIARNLALDLIRGTARQGDHRAPLARTMLARAPQAGAAEGSRAKALFEALDRLPQDQRETVSLKVFSRLTFAQIAEVMSVPAGTAASRYRYACEKLAEILSAEGETS
jgi:RNA polymerase sigma factor (sigma-70 family)